MLNYKKILLLLWLPITVLATISCIDIKSDIDKVEKTINKKVITWIIP